MRNQHVFVALLFVSLVIAVSACGASAPAATSPAAAPTAQNAATSVSSPAGSPANPTTPAVAPTSAAAATSVQPTAAASPTTPAAAPTAASAATAAQPTAASQPTAAASGAAGNYVDIVFNAEVARLKQPAMRIRSTRTDENGAISMALTEYVAPDRLHVVTPSGGEDIIIKGVGTYVKRNGTWSVSPVDLTSLLDPYDPQSVENQRSQVPATTVKLVGPDVLNGKPMTVYQFEEVLSGLGANGGDLHSNLKIWIGVVDGLPYEVQSDSDSITTTGKLTHTTDTFEYDPTIKIEKPI